MKPPAPFSLSRSFPLSMNAYGVYNTLNLTTMLKTFKICNGNNKFDILFTVKFHMGFVSRALLGIQCGHHSPPLQGPSYETRDTVIAAASEESSASGSGVYLSFNPHSAVILPPLLCPSGSPEKTMIQMVTESMRAVRLEGPGRQVGIDISMVGVGPEQQLRAGFQWRKEEEGG
ncbi:hypothetical protein B0H66DRAFT_618135 [Apodospora peruviana]|uniref:Uncharacterized protein n=1 Tax=Apodospora peruviana TaxID=516989 RepID=A0AAE0IKG8_9PEZI|nr:hypothetical protein B0H66DRAFT_618135 [Apodospora peruviana]